MADGPPGAAARGDAIGLRLALAFLGVALAAVALLAGLTAAFAAADVSSLASRQRAQLTDAIAVAAGSAWDRNHGWRFADLSPALDLVARTGAGARILAPSGRQVAKSPGFPAHAHGAQLSRPIVVQGERVGTAVVRFTGSGLGGADAALETALLRAIAGAAGLAALLALLTGLAVARRITRPVTRLIRVTRAMGGGDRAARVGPVAAPGELRELATAFDQMADGLDRQEQLRRDLVADIAHELRTPIAVLQAGHEALLDGVAEPTPEQLASLRDEVLRLARMVGDLQTLAAADAAAMQLTLRPGDLAEHRRHRGGQPGRPVRGGRDHPAPPAHPGAGAGRRALAAPGGDQPADQRAEVHPGRRPGDHRGRARRWAGEAAGQRHRGRHPGRGTAAHLRPVLARPAGIHRVRQRHRPGHRGRAGPGPRRPADRGQPARAGHRADAHPAPRLTPGLVAAHRHQATGRPARLHHTTIGAASPLHSGTLCCFQQQQAAARTGRAADQEARG